MLSLKGSMVETDSQEAEMTWEIILPLLQERKVIRNTPQEVFVFWDIQIWNV